MKINKILENEIQKVSKDNSVAVLLSGGVDSLSIAFALKNLGKQVNAYSFKLDNCKNYDSDKAEKFVIFLIGIINVKLCRQTIFIKTFLL